MRELHGNSEKDPVYGYLENPRELIFIDMDGVLVDMEKGMDIWSHKLGIPTKELFDKDLPNVKIVSPTEYIVGNGNDIEAKYIFRSLNLFKLFSLISSMLCENFKIKSKFSL